MRENRTYGSEGGKSGPTGPPYPYQSTKQVRQTLASSATGESVHRTKLWRVRLPRNSREYGYDSGYDWIAAEGWEKFLTAQRAHGAASGAVSAAVFRARRNKRARRTLPCC